MRNIFFIIVFLLIAIKSYSQEEGWDPTQPTQPGEVSDFGSGTGTNNSDSHGLHLNAIFSKPDNSTVVINGKILHAGDSIEGYKINAISKNSVTLKSNTNESFELKFLDFNFKQPRK